jgi:hypothetical protein
MRGGREVPRDIKQNGGTTMKLDYNVTGAERKSLVGAISQTLNAPVKYLGAPSFAYEVGGYHIDKEGTLTGNDDKQLVDALAERGFAGNGAYDNVPTPSATAIEMPLDGFTPEKLDNLFKLVTAKEGLIKAALGADTLPLQQTDEDGGKLRFHWFDLSDTDAPDYADKVMAYAQLVSKLCKAAKEKKRVTAKEREPAENPKYAMRCFLLSIGMIGDEYKTSRKILLSRLEGNSSFKGGSRPTYTAHLYTYPNGEETDPMDCDWEEFTSLAKAKARCDEFLADCESLKFAGCHVEGEGGEYLYEILCDGTVNKK